MSTESQQNQSLSQQSIPSATSDTEQIYDPAHIQDPIHGKFILHKILILISIYDC